MKINYMKLFVDKELYCVVCKPCDNELFCFF